MTTMTRRGTSLKQPDGAPADGTVAPDPAWVSANITEFSTWVRQDSGVAMTFGARFASPMWEVVTNAATALLMLFFAVQLALRVA